MHEIRLDLVKQNMKGNFFWKSEISNLSNAVNFIIYLIFAYNLCFTSRFTFNDETTILGVQN